MDRESSATATAGREIVISRVLNAPRELVFSAWTDPDHVGIWWGPRGFSTTTHEMDVKPGGVWRFTMHHAEFGNFENRIVYVELAEPERIVYDHGDGEGKEQFRSTVTFEAQDGKTLLTMRMLFPSVEERDRVVREYGAIEGGNQTVDRLEEYLESLFPSGRVLEITRIFDAPRDVVFEAWTKPERFVQWWGPRGYTTPFCEIDLRPGGLMRYCMRSAEGQDVWCGGVFRDVVPGSRLVYRDFFTDQAGKAVSPTEYGVSGDWPAETLVTVTFEDFDGKTKLTLRHSAGTAPAAEIEGASQGWNESFDRLAELLAG
jgi:uncharacterized protein YndB with AHSA1/START domain